MIEIYRSTNKDYTHNGDMVLQPTSCTYDESKKQIDISHPIDKEGRWKYIQADAVLKCNGKLYRIHEPEQGYDEVTAYAMPIAYDLSDKVLLDVRPTDKTGQEALDIILNGTEFTGHSDIATVSTAYYVRKNIIESLFGDDENSFLNRWGGEYYFDNFDIYINDKLGSDNGYRVEEGYNIEAFHMKIDDTSVVTRIIPTGYDGIMLDGDKPWVDSPLINLYSHVKEKVIEFSDIKVKDENSEDGYTTLAEAQNAMKERCAKLYEGGLDKPKVTCNIDIVELSQTEEYKDMKGLLNLHKGDTVYVKVPSLDVDVVTRVTSFTRDEITNTYLTIELGSEVETYSQQQADVNSIIDKIMSGGKVNGGMVGGIMDALNVKFRALRDVAQPQKERAIIFEDRVPDSPTFGCMALGTMGFEIASEYKTGTEDWDFRTFGTGKGFVADCIIAGILKSANEATTINMNTGEINFTKGKIEGSNSSWDLDTGEIKSTMPDGSEIVISPSAGFYNKIGNTQREYYHLFYQAEVTLPSTSGSDYTSTTITLPDEFKNKLFKPYVSLRSIYGDNGVVMNLSDYVSDINYSAPSVTVRGFLATQNLNTGEIKYENEKLGINLVVIA